MPGKVYFAAVLLHVFKYAMNAIFGHLLSIWYRLGAIFSWCFHNWNDVLLSGHRQDKSAERWKDLERKASFFGRLDSSYGVILFPAVPGMWDEFVWYALMTSQYLFVDVIVITIMPEYGLGNIPEAFNSRDRLMILSLLVWRGLIYVK